MSLLIETARLSPPRARQYADIQVRAQGVYTYIYIKRPRRAADPGERRERERREEEEGRRRWEGERAPRESRSVYRVDRCIISTISLMIGYMIAKKTL